MRQVMRLQQVYSDRPPKAFSDQAIAEARSQNLAGCIFGGLVALELVEVLETMLEGFGGDRHFTSENLLDIKFSRVFKGALIPVAGNFIATRCHSSVTGLRRKKRGK